MNCPELSKTERLVELLVTGHESPVNPRNGPDSEGQLPPSHFGGGLRQSGPTQELLEDELRELDDEEDGW